MLPAIRRHYPRCATLRASPASARHDASHRSAWASLTTGAINPSRRLGWSELIPGRGAGISPAPSRRRRPQTFFSRADYLLDQSLLAEHVEASGVAVWSRPALLPPRWSPAGRTRMAGRASSALSRSGLRDLRVSESATSSAPKSTLPSERAGFRIAWPLIARGWRSMLGGRWTRWIEGRIDDGSGAGPGASGGQERPAVWILARSHL
jgi:hypothetical protein